MMADNNPQRAADNNSGQADNQGSSTRAWKLVIWMLIALTVLVIFILVLPLDSACQEPASNVQAATTPAVNANANVNTSNANVNANANSNAAATNNSNNTNGGNATNANTTNANRNTGATTTQPSATPQSSLEAARPPSDQCLQFRITILDRRKDFLALLLSAFGAWVGAGAAYFFGRENLHVAAQSLLQMQQQTSGSDRLRATSISQIPPKPLSWLAKESDKISAAYDWLKADPSRWFIPVTDANGILTSVLKEEALYRYIIDASHTSPPTSPPAHMMDTDTTIGDLLKRIKSDADYKQFRQIYVTVKMNMSAETANELMDQQGIFLAIVVDDQHKPTHFITTADVRKLLLS